MLHSSQLVQIRSLDPRVQIFRRNFEMPDGSGTMEVDAYVIVTEQFAAICDTLLCPADVEEMLTSLKTEIGDRPLLVVNSHADWDHYWGNGYFTGKQAAPIIAQAHGPERIRSEEARISLLESQQQDPLFKTVTLVEPTITFERNLTLRGGDLTLELFSTPGHRIDHLAIWIPELRLLLGFDAIETPFPIIEDATTVPTMFATLEHFLSLEPEEVYCSHGKVRGIIVIQRNLAYLKEVQRRCQLYLQSQQRSQKAEAAQIDAPVDGLIGYSLADVIADIGASLTVASDDTFYTWAHQNNIRCIMEWLENHQGH